MKKTFYLILLIVFAFNAAHAQQTITSENVSPYNSISLSGKLIVELIPADVSSINIEVMETDVSRMKWGVNNGTLSVSYRPSQGNKESAQVKIYYTDSLSNINVSGAELRSDSPLCSDIVKISVLSGAKVILDLDSLDAELEVTGNSAAQFSGKTRYLTMRATEKSKCDGRELEAVSAEVESATGAEAFVSVTERLVGNAKTGSTIFYKGSPVIYKDRSSKLNSNVMGSSILNIGR